MPSTIKQKPREKRSRQSDVMSGLKNVGIMLGSYTKNEANGQIDNDTNLDLESNRLQRSSNLVGEDFRSLLNKNSREQ